MSKTYIVIVNYNGHNDTIECLESVLKITDVDFQILVIDNSENDESLAQIISWAKGNSKQIPTAHSDFILPLTSKPIDWKRVDEDSLLDEKLNEKLLLIKAKENKGFASANNIGLRYVLKYNNFDFCWLLNNDTVVAPNALSDLIATSKTNHWGVTGSVLYDYGTSNIQAMGGQINKLLGTVTTIKDQRDFNKIDLIVGASFLISNKCLKQTGLLCEEYFLYYEETDYCYTARKQGYAIGTAINSVVYHKGGATTGASPKAVKNIPAKIDIIQLESRINFHKKHLKNTLGLYTAILFSILNRIRKKQFERIPKIIKLLYKYK